MSAGITPVIGFDAGHLAALDWAMPVTVVEPR
jgi:hypothetical protein